MATGIVQLITTRTYSLFILGESDSLKIRLLSPPNSLVITPKKPLPYSIRLIYWLRL